MNSFNGAGSAVFRGRRATSAATPEYWVHSYFQKFFRFVNGFYSGAIVCWGCHTGLGPMPYLLLLLLFEAAPQDELNASTSFLHLLWSPLFCSRHFFRASALQGEATCDMSVATHASDVQIIEDLESVSLIVLALQFTLPACRSCLCRSRLLGEPDESFCTGTGMIAQCSHRWESCEFVFCAQDIHRSYPTATGYSLGTWAQI